MRQTTTERMAVHRRTPNGAAEVHWYTDGEMVRDAYTLREADDDYGQANIMVRKVRSRTGSDTPLLRCPATLDTSRSRAASSSAFDYWKNIDKETGEKIEAAVRNGSA